MNSWWGCATQFSKSCPYFKPKNVIFHIGFQTSLKSIPIFRPGLIQPVPGSQIVGERLRSFLLFYFHVCAFSIQQTQLSWSLEQARPDQAEIMSSLLARKIRVRLLFMYFFFLVSQECPSGWVFTRGSTIVFAPCIHANKWQWFETDNLVRVSWFLFMQFQN